MRNNSVKANCRYDLVYSNDPVKTSDYMAMEWFEEVKKEYDK